MINVDLAGSETKYVIVGTVTGQVAGAEVSVSQTKNFSDNNDFPGVTGALVTIESNGMVDTLYSAGNGIYRSDAITGAPGTTYNLTVNIGGTIFHAVSTMPQQVPFDSLYTSVGAFSNNSFATVVYRDPIGVSNYYKWVQYVNGKKEKSIFVSDDEFTDGQRVQSKLNYNNDTDDKTRDIHSGDSVRIEQYCIDGAVYKYWYSLNNGATGTSQSASPANPVTNITGGTVMGYFSAQTIQTRAIKVL